MRLNLVVAIGLAALVAACSAEPTATAITPALLESPSQIQKVANRLEPDDREAFTRYVAGRTMATAMGAPPLVNAAGDDPATVQEAILIQRWADGLGREMEAARAPHQAIIMGDTSDVSTADYNAAVKGYNDAQTAYQAKRAAGPPVDLAG